MPPSSPLSILLLRQLCSPLSPVQSTHLSALASPPPSNIPTSGSACSLKHHLARWLTPTHATHLPRLSCLPPSRVQKSSSRVLSFLPRHFLLTASRFTIFPPTSSPAITHLEVWPTLSSRLAVGASAPGPTPALSGSPAGRPAAPRPTRHARRPGGSGVGWGR